MAHVLVAEEEAVLRHIYTAVCESEGHTVTAPQDFWGVIATLRSTLHPLAVVYGRDGYVAHRMQEEERVAAFEASLDAMRAHRYVAIGWQMDPLAPRLRTIEEQLEVEFVSRPFELDDLIAAVNRAAGQLVERGV